MPTSLAATMDTMTDAPRSDAARPHPSSEAAAGAQPLPIRDTSIRLGQALKLAGLVEDGALAREVITEGHVLVNGAPETRRGAQLHDGDVVEFQGEALVVEAESPEA